MHRGFRSSAPDIRDTEGSLRPHPFARYVNPHLSSLLSSLELDKRFVTGKRSELVDDEGRTYLDCVSAYGALPFGFNPPEIWDALHEVQVSLEPSLIQPSFLNAAGELAERLIHLAPGDLQYVTFANSGAEAVEAAIKMCRAATGRTGIITTENSFHGKTLGALAATGNAEYQEGFAPPIDQFANIPFGDARALQELLEARPNEFAAVIIEPIQGEGGIVEPPPGYWSEIRSICNSFGILLVFDEIQTGLGRTGKLFCCEHDGVTPDVMTLAKALGGGLVPIGAVMANEQAYSREFALRHSSTFAGNALACRAGIASLEMLTAANSRIVKRVADNGVRLKRRLVALAKKYPHLISGVRGRGYLLGVVLAADRTTWPDSLMGVAAEQSLLAPVFASYLLNVEGVRVAPTLNGKSVIRIEPALTFSWAECERLLTALENTLRAFKHGNTGQILSSIILRRPFPERGGNPAGGTKGESLNNLSMRPKPGEKRFAFLTHPLDATSMGDFDPNLAWLPEHLLSDITDRVAGVVEPFVQSHTRVTSATGDTVYGEFIAVPHTAKQLAEMPRSEANECISQALEIARQRGAQMVGLGAFTSVVTRGGKSVTSDELPLTTGNSYTAIASAEGIRAAMDKLCERMGRDTCAAVIGATGAIGRAMACLLAEDVGQLILIGNPQSNPEQVQHRLTRVAVSVCQHVLNCRPERADFAPKTLAARIVELAALHFQDHQTLSDAQWIEMVRNLEAEAYILNTQDMGSVPSANVVVTATSATEAVLNSSHLRFGAMVCDLSRPRNVSREVKEQRADVLVFDGGLVAIPGKPNIGRFGLEAGQAFSCMAETMLLTLAGHFENTSLGADLNSDTMRGLRNWAREHGFRVAKLQSFGKKITRWDWRRIRQVRHEAGAHPIGSRGRNDVNWLEDSTLFSGPV